MILLNRVPYVPWVPVWSTCPRAKSVSASHCYLRTCQRPNERTNYSTWRANVPKAYQFFGCQEAYHFFNYVSKWFLLLNFSIMLNICKFLEYLHNCRIWLLKWCKIQSNRICIQSRLIYIQSHLMYIQSNYICSVSSYFYSVNLYVLSLILFIFSQVICIQSQLI